MMNQRFFFVVFMILWQLPAFADKKEWLVKCAQSKEDLSVTSNALKDKGVNVLSTTSESGRFRNDLCGSTGLLLGFYLRESDVNLAKEADAFLKSPPLGFPEAPRRTH